MAKPGVQDPQIGENFGDSAHRRARAVIGQVLIHADGGRQTDDGVHRWFAQATGDQAERFHVLALPLLVQDVERQRGFSRPRQPGDDDELVLGDLERDVFQIVQARVADGDGWIHGCSKRP